LVIAQRPQARLHLAGNRMPADLLSASIPGVGIQGRVPDAVAYMQAHPVMVVPLFSAGGMRVKIIEGMAMGRAVISTTIGAEGIACTNGLDVLLADDAPTFVAQMVGLVDAPERARSIGHAAHELVVERYSEAAIASDLSRFFNDLLHR
jgi:glycosyltransferase involved in cell wall biosynthesis